VAFGNLTVAANAEQCKRRARSLKRARPCHGVAGFTLLEVVVAFAITALALAGLVQATGVGLGSSDTAARTVEAVSEAQSLLAQAGIATPLASGESNGERDGFRWHIVIRPVATRPGVATTLTEAVARNAELLPPTVLYSIESTVRWRSSWREHRISLTTYRIGRGQAEAGSTDG
jgi:general secretion pathway protein I